MNEQDDILAGKIGLFISVILWLVCTWRLCFHARRRQNDQSHDSIVRGSAENQQRLTAPSVRWVTRRRAFHVLLW
ncbi:MAG: hypothetical protein ACI8RD_010050 [Bacillariaceae sp.]|jgi:hypothetical protein